MFSRNILFILEVMIFLTWNATSANAQEHDSGMTVGQLSKSSLQKKPSHNPEEFGGVVVNLTTTGFGRQFYERFVALWQDNPLCEQYSIAVRERASARYGSQIFIDYAQRRMFQVFLPPSANAIRIASENAVGVVYENIMAVDVQRLMFRDADLGADEI